MLNQYSKLFFYNCVNLLQISSLHWLKKLWLRMACQGMKIILNLILLFIWFPGFPGIPGITSLKFPFPSLPVAICEFPFPSRKTGMWFSISLPVPGSQKAFPAHPWPLHPPSMGILVQNYYLFWHFGPFAKDTCFNSSLVIFSCQV